MNDDVRAEFRSQAGWDPIEIWGRHNDAASLRQFLDFRADLARRMQAHPAYERLAELAAKVR